MAAATVPQSGFGTAITWNAHDIGYIQDISGPNIRMDTIDISSHDSANGYRQFVGGMLDGGEVTFDVLHVTGDVTGQKTMLTDMHAKTERQVVITLPDNSTWTFNALVTGFSPAAPYNDRLTASITLKVSGQPVYAAST